MRVVPVNRLSEPYQYARNNTCAVKSAYEASKPTPAKRPSCLFPNARNMVKPSAPFMTTKGICMARHRAIGVDEQGLPRRGSWWSYMQTIPRPQQSRAPVAPRRAVDHASTTRSKPVANPTNVNPSVACPDEHVGCSICGVRAEVGRAEVAGTISAQ